MSVPFIARILFFFIAVCILILSLIPLSQPQIIEVSDKISHIIAYACLAFLFVFAFTSRFPHSAVLSLVSVGFCTLYGSIIEFFQSFTGRTPEFLDILADCSGALAGTLLAVIIVSIQKKHSS